MSSESEVFCGRCGVLNAVARGRCRECAQPLSGSVPPHAAPWSADEPRRICPRCRRGNDLDAALCIDCGARLRVGGGAMPLPRYRPEPARSSVALPPRPCPGCGSEMEPGVAFLDEGSFWESLLLQRRGWMPLVFRRTGTTRKERVLRPGEDLHAQRCPGCNGVWIAPPPPRDAGT